MERNHKRTGAKAAGSRLPDPDDAELRVVLTEDARRSLASLPRKEVAARIRSSHAGKDSVAPSTVSRIVHGLSNPTRRVASQIASLLKRDPLEVMSGLEQPYPISEWGPRVIYKQGGFRERVFRLFRHLSPFLDEHVHFASPYDPERTVRRIIFPARAEFEYQVFQVEIPEVEADGFDFVLSNRILSSPPLVFDFGIIEADRGELRAYETWMRRYQAYPLIPGTRKIWVKVWVDGDDTPILIRSTVPFDLPDMRSEQAVSGAEIVRMIPAAELPPGSAPVVWFPAGGVQTHAPYTKIRIVETE